MPKVFVQDVVPSGRRSIRNVPLPGSKVTSNASEEYAQDRADEPEEMERVSNDSGKRPPKNTSNKDGGRKIWLWLIIALVLVVVIYLGSFLFVGATVNVVPKEAAVQVNISGEVAPESTDGKLGYTIATLSREGTKEVQASGEETVQKKASGTIIVYNNFSNADQTLIANTRFETAGGLIFRIGKQIVVPGQKVVSGVTTPGSIAVEVTADQAGDEYNVGLADFTIPGFKGDPRFEKFSAKSDPAHPIQGGFSGKVKKVTSADSAAAKVSIETKLRNDLQDSLSSQIPDTHVLFKTATTYSFEELPQRNSSSTQNAIIAEKGTIYGILFDRAELSKYIAEQQVGEGEDEVSILNFEDLNFSIEDITTFNPGSNKPIKFKLSGNAQFVWDVDEIEVAKSLAGQKKANVKAILSNFEAIERASVTVRPPWIFTIPGDPAKIEVKVEAKK